MLRVTKNMKEKYEKIQNYLFSLIPEKWEEIYLYASVVTGANGSGELYFYYLPKGILKKKPINVYEVPQRFNINEEQYLQLVEELYKCIKDLKQDFIDTEQELWSSLTISIANSKFKIEYNYDSLPRTEEESNARHVIWRYKYLKIGGEKKEERKILDEYFSNRKKIKREIYETGLYIRTDINTITFDKEDTKTEKEVIVYEKEDITKDNKQELLREENQEKEQKKANKNQILNM